MSSSASIPCRWCGRTAGVKSIREKHGKWVPRCLARRTELHLRRIGWRRSGQFTHALQLAGLTRVWPFRVWVLDWIREHVPRQGIISKSVTSEIVGFYSICPDWAYDMAKRLYRDKQLARKLGFVQHRAKIRKQDVVTIVRMKKNGFVLVQDKSGRWWEEVDVDKPLPMHVRVQILRHAAANEIAREFILDDPETAAIMIRSIS